MNSTTILNKLLTLTLFLGPALAAYSQVELIPNGEDNTYELITSILAPGHNPIETPDCSHTDFGEHIDQVYDDELDAYVFRFHLHVDSDDDRCINFDRQRNEIKSYDKSPDNLLGSEGETVVYKWRFKLMPGYQSSPNFTHLHQLKPVGGAFESLPMYTLTTRKGSPDQLELRYAETDDQVTLSKTDLAPFIGSWLEVTETIIYGFDGTYDIRISKVADDETLFSYKNNSIANWRPGTSFVRPKWGIYRSLINKQDLRDEEVLYAQFSIDELDPVSADETAESDKLITSIVDNILHIRNINKAISNIVLYDIEGRRVLNRTRSSHNGNESINISPLVRGIYILKLEGDKTDNFKVLYR